MANKRQSIISIRNTSLQIRHRRYLWPTNMGKRYQSIQIVRFKIVLAGGQMAHLLRWVRIKSLFRWRKGILWGARSKVENIVFLISNKCRSNRLNRMITNHKIINLKIWMNLCKVNISYCLNRIHSWPNSKSIWIRATI